MASIKEITALCKAGNVENAYAMALADWQVAPDDMWAQREVGWAVYYLLKYDIEQNDAQTLNEHLDTYVQLSLLAGDDLIQSSILWRITEYVRGLQKNDFHSLDKLFATIQPLKFKPSRPYSFLLKLILQFEGWSRMVDFLEWWQLDHFMPEDYKPFQSENGKRLMALAERGYIAMARELVKGADKEKMRAFIPKMETLMDEYPDMLYPGYFCGKMLITLGTTPDEALQKVIPFAKKKVSEFWVWQLLAEIFADNDKEHQMACLLRASYCRTQEAFLGKLRIRLAGSYIHQGDYNRARHHIDIVARTYLSHGWRLPFEVQCWVHEPWIQQAKADSSDPIDWKSITDALLFSDTKESIAVVSFVDFQKHRAAIIYGEKKSSMERFDRWKLKVNVGTLLKIRYTENQGKVAQIIGTETVGVDAITDLPYCKKVSGMVLQRDGQAFAFLKTVNDKYFIAPPVVAKNHLSNGQSIEALAVLDYNKKRDSWGWNCVSVAKKNET